MKKIFFRVVPIVLCFSFFLISCFVFPEYNIFVKADIVSEGNCGDGLYWKLDDYGVLTLSGNGEMEDYSFRYVESEDGYEEVRTIPPWESCKNNIIKVIVGDGVETISGYAFFGYEYINSVEIASTVKEIGCFAFCGCTSLTDIELADSVIEIREGAFYDTACFMAFDRENDEVLYIGNHLIYASNILKDGKYDVKEGTLDIAERAFYSESMSGSDLCELYIPASVQFIGDFAFSACTRLTAIYVDAENQYYSDSDGVLYNKDLTEIILFPPSSSITEFTIPDSVTRIRTAAFSESFNLKDLYIPSSVQTFEQFCFSYCESLEGIYIEDISVWFSLDFGDAWGFVSTPLDSGALLYVDGEVLTELIIPENVSAVAPMAFRGLSSLKTVIIPGHVESVGVAAFHDCNALESIVICSDSTVINDAFLPGEALKHFIYCGTEEQWQSSFEFTEPALSDDAVVHFDHQKEILEILSEKQPTCVLQGNTGGYYCNECSIVLAGVDILEVDENNHVNMTLVNSKEVSCTENGYSGDIVCIDCGKTVSEGSVIVSDGHDMGLFVQTIPATCFSFGEERSDCSKCDYYEKRTTEKTEHTEEIILAVAPSCTEGGFSEGKKCSVCNEVLIYPEAVGELGHDMGEFEETRAATCKEAGEKKSLCSRCDYSVIKEIPVIDHVPETEEGKAPTCTENGVTDGIVCSVCGETIEEQKVMPATGHSFGDWTVIKQATCTEKGIESRRCAACDYTEKREIPEKSHEYDEDGTCNECKKNCKHICHRQNNVFVRIIWCIIRFFCEFFGVGKYCSCGMAHY